MKNNLDDIEVVQFWRDGYLHLRNVFTEAEISRWRQRSLSSDAKTEELLSDDVLREIVLHPGVIGIARDILGSDPIYYGGSVVRAGVIGGTGWHKDNSDRYDGNAPDWQVERYPVLAYGVYMQDHDDQPEGLELRSGSHLFPDITSGRRVAPPIRKGDLMIWTQRTTHSANSQVLRGIGHRVMPNGFLWRILNRINSDIFYRRHPEKRVTAIGTLAGAHPLFDRHMEYKRSRTYQVDAWKSAQWSDDSIRRADELGLKLITPQKALEGVGERTNAEYRQIPY